MDFSRQSQQARIDNMQFALENVKEYGRKIRIRDYMPGQVTYCLGDYPEKVLTMPTEYDEKLIKSMAERGVELIQVHEEWNDAMGYHGGDKYHPHDPEGLHKFVDLCHDNGIKIIPYVSSGYLNPADKYYKPEFSHTDARYDGCFLHYRKGSADSAAWREFILPMTLHIMDEYGFDGIYNDWGYDGLNTEMQNKIISGEPFDRHNMPYDPHVEDLLCTIYEEIHKRGGVYKIHDDSTHGIYKEKLYDYLWIGEGERDAKKQLLYKDAPLYIVPCPDKAWLPKDNPRFYFALTIPYVQVPLLQHGRPVSGMGMVQPHIEYTTLNKLGEPNGDYVRRMKKSEFCRNHPNGPYVYGRWGLIPDDPNEIEYWSDFLALYKPMVTEGTSVYVDIKKSDIVKSELNEDTIVTMFINEKTYMVVSNIGDEPVTVELANEWLNRETGKKEKVITLNGKDIIFLEKI